MKGRSTVSNLITITQFISQHLDANTQVDVLYTDLSKAFDKLDHNILLKKLDFFGLSNGLLNLFKSYLSNRLLYVECCGYKSNSFLAMSGVPQGSILGPLLFVIYINDIIENLDCHYLLYADDVKIYTDIRSEEDCIGLQACLASIERWCVRNRLDLNAAKCTVMTFTKKASPIIYNYSLHNVDLSRPETIKDLGIFFDSKLNFKFHIDSTIKSAYKSLGFLNRATYGFSDEKVYMLLYNALVRSKLEYASVVWSPGYNAFKSDIEDVQRRFLKLLSFRLDGTYPPVGVPQSVLLQRFDLVSLNKRRMMHSLLFLYKILHNICDCPDFLSQVCLQAPVRATRTNRFFYLETARTNVLNFSPLHQMCSTYNNLQDSIDMFNTSLSNIMQLFNA